MATSDKPADTPLVACEVCLKEVPVGEAKIAEAVDYVAHFCGLACYEKWKNQADFAKDPGHPPVKP
jgi:hypothetical protein